MEINRFCILFKFMRLWLNAVIRVYLSDILIMQPFIELRLYLPDIIRAELLIYLRLDLLFTFMTYNIIDRNIPCL